MNSRKVLHAEGKADHVVVSGHVVVSDNVVVYMKGDDPSEGVEPVLVVRQKTYPATPPKLLGTALGVKPTYKVHKGLKFVCELGEDDSSEGVEHLRAQETEGSRRIVFISDDQMRIPNATSPAGIEERLRAVAARRLLLQLEEKRAVAAAAAAGKSQVEIAKDLGVSQPTVHRLLRQLEADPAALERGPREVIAEAAAGVIDRQTMLAELAVIDPKPGRSAPDGDADGYILGAWDDVVDAWERGWLTDDEYEQLARL